MLIAFDFDGTLSDSEMTVLLGEEAGVAGEIDRITERAMNDEISYAESLYARAELWTGSKPSASRRRSIASNSGREASARSRRCRRPATTSQS